MVGRITPERYDEMVVGYENELAELKQKLTELKNDVSLFSQQQQAMFRYRHRPNMADKPQCLI